MNINKSSFGLRPVKDTAGRIFIREVYYNDQGQVCDIEMQVKHPYIADEAEAIESLKPMYYNIKAYEMYNPSIIEYDPMVDRLAPWTLGEHEALESTE
jgi:hypothetical protein